MLVLVSALWLNACSSATTGRKLAQDAVAAMGSRPVAQPRNRGVKEKLTPVLESATVCNAAFEPFHLKQEYAFLMTDLERSHDDLRGALRIAGKRLKELNRDVCELL